MVFRRYEGNRCPDYAENCYSLGFADFTITGGGLWYDGKTPRTVHVVMVVELDPENRDVLDVYCLIRHNIDKYGLIYTDPGFLKDARNYLRAIGFPHPNAFDYSEQGMQSKNYVHMVSYNKKNFRWFKNMIVF